MPYYETAKAIGIDTVAVYSDVGEHVAMADEAVGLARHLPLKVICKQTGLFKRS